MEKRDSLEGWVLRVNKGYDIPKPRGKWIKFIEKMKPGDSILLPTRKACQAFQSSATRRRIKTLTRPENEKLRLWIVGPMAPKPGQNKSEES